ncbi:hypothetical protein Ahia01_000969800, partial [Argonauta hians]
LNVGHTASIIHTLMVEQKMSCNSKEQDNCESLLLVPENLRNNCDVTHNHISSDKLHILKEFSKSPTKSMGADKVIPDLQVQTNATQTSSTSSRICSTCLSEYNIVIRDSNTDEPEFSVVCRACRLEGGLYHMRKQIKALEDFNDELKSEVTKLQQNNSELKWKCHELEGCIEYLEMNLEQSRTSDAPIECSDPSPKNPTPPGIDITDWIDFNTDCYNNNNNNNNKSNLYVPAPCRRASSSSPCPSLVCSQHCHGSCTSSSRSKDECSHMKTACCSNSSNSSSRMQDSGTGSDQGFGNKVLIIGCSVIKHVWGGGVKNMARQ